MSDKVTPIRPGAFDPDAVGPDVVIPPDHILETHKGRCRQVCLVFLDSDGILKVAGSHRTTESHMLLHLGMLELLKLVAENLEP